MKKMTLILTFAFVATVFIIPAHSGMKKTAQVGLQFLKVDMHPRAAAMGSAFMLVGEGASAMFYNPAGVARMDQSFDFFAGQTQWIADITYNTIGLVKNQGNWGSFGVNAILCDYGSIEGTRVAWATDTEAQIEKGFVETGDLDVGAYAIGLSYARSLSTKFTVGGTVKWVNQRLDENIVNDGTTVKNEVSDVAFDFGTIFYPGFHSFRFGMSIRNFSRELKYEKEGFQLPLTFTFGVAMDVLDFMSDDHRDKLLVAIDAVHPRDYSERVHLGAEYLFMDIFALRAGYKTNYDEEGLTAGLGFNYNLAGIKVRLDYAYASFGIFDAVNRFSVGLGF